MGTVLHRLVAYVLLPVVDAGKAVHSAGQCAGGDGGRSVCERSRAQDAGAVQEGDRAGRGAGTGAESRVAP